MHLNVSICIGLGWLEIPLLAIAAEVGRTNATIWEPSDRGGFSFFENSGEVGLFASDARPNAPIMNMLFNSNAHSSHLEGLDYWIKCESINAEQGGVAAHNHGLFIISGSEDYKYPWSSQAGDDASLPPGKVDESFLTKREGEPVRCGQQPSLAETRLEVRKIGEVGLALCCGMHGKTWSERKKPPGIVVGAGDGNVSEDGKRGRVLGKPLRPCRSRKPDGQ